jgi:hypothetical protein
VKFRYKYKSLKLQQTSEEEDMKFIICLVFVIYCTSIKSIQCSEKEEAKIIKSEYVNNGNKGYHFE